MFVFCSGSVLILVMCVLLEIGLRGNEIINLFVQIRLSMKYGNGFVDCNYGNDIIFKHFTLESSVSSCTVLM